MSTAETERYCSGVHSIEFRRCKHCGCVTDMGINARLLDAGALAASRRHHFDDAVTEEYLA